MNKAKYTGRPERSYPVSTESLDFIQEQIFLAAEWAKGVGGNYIMSGCVKNGTNVSDGVVVIAGEILRFVGGTAQANIRIVEETQSITAGGTTYAGARTVRTVQFGTNIGNADTYKWADFAPLPTNRFLLENSATKAELETVKALVMPKGAIIMWSGAPGAIPQGFALCDGATVNGVQTPDLRGRFIVGYYAKRSNESSANSDLFASYGLMGSTGGSKEVALTVAQMPSHSHTLQWQSFTNNAKENDATRIVRGNTGQLAASKATTATGGDQAHENRPPYYTLAFIIKTV